MSIIKILPENLANQIAAGEVVERPASVVKELVENAIDAGATGLTVEIEGGGTALIRVIDNGVGMDRDDILLSLERHATSKLIRAEDLDAITTLGFRGEAVPSIASVARLTITSRPAGAELGSRVEVKFGKVVKVHEMGCAYGTVIEVRDLFGNVPARKKFLKSTRTELAHIEEMVRNYGLVSTELALSYLVNGGEVLGLPAAGNDPAPRLRRLLGAGAVGELIEINSPLDAEGLAVAGFLVAPERSGPGGRLRVFVNGRPVRDRLLFHAVGEGLRNYLLKGHAPTGVIYLAVPPGEVDVNVHPTKQEVRFHRPNLVHQLIVNAVTGAMVAQQSGLRRSLFGATRLEPEATATSPSALRESPPLAPARQATSLESAKAVPIAPRPTSPVVPAVAPPQPEQPATPPPRRPVPSPVTYQQPRLPERKVAEPPVAPIEVAEATVLATPPSAQVAARVERREESSGVGNLRVIGQLFDSYILCEGEGTLVAIDQHAAQERLIFERLRAQVAAGGALRQGLLFPVTVELSAGELTILEEAAEAIAALGLEVREFGGATWLIQAVPVLLAHLPPVEVLRGILASFAEKAGTVARGESRRLDDVLAVMACKAAVKANHALLPEEMAALLKEMQGHEVFSHCPHGRPTVRVFTATELKKWFHRT
ncbi:MAG: DNA mismatch repair endonuclease MutL [Desulfobulbaceae bacterium]|nr:DNA mismatch repair endonuclease MutL [Desulfobulbaceae bacterium]